MRTGRMVLGILGAACLFSTPASAQREDYSGFPSQLELDRLDLQRRWHAQVPMLKAREHLTSLKIGDGLLRDHDRHEGAARVVVLKIQLEDAVVKVRHHKDVEVAAQVLGQEHRCRGSLVGIDLECPAVVAPAKFRVASVKHVVGAQTNLVDPEGDICWTDTHVAHAPVDGDRLAALRIGRIHGHDLQNQVAVGLGDIDRSGRWRPGLACAPLAEP